MRSGVRNEFMNFFHAPTRIRNAWRWSVLLAGIFLVAGVRARAQEPSRFLLVFETSPGLKKNLPALKETLDGIFSSNLQHEMQENDDLAVWTVDQDLHTGTFPLASWSPDDAEMYSSRLKDFLGHQSYTRHATLAAIQPLLNRVMKTSPQLTVLIFCDGQSNVLGTPYDGGVNAIFKKAVVENKGVPGLFVLVLRSNQGAWLGCSVNRMPGPLNFPKFPPPPKPEPPVVKPVPVSAPAVAPVPALIIVGTNVGSDIAALNRPAPVPVTNPPVTSPPAASAPAQNPAPVSNPPLPAKSAPMPVPVVQKNPAVAPLVISTAPAVAANSSTVANCSAAAIAADAPPDTGFQKLLIIGGGLLVAALVLVIWLVTRSRQPRGSLITSSMQDDPRQPPRK
jgi:hypothetical protein